MSQYLYQSQEDPQETCTLYGRDQYDPLWEALEAKREQEAKEVIYWFDGDDCIDEKGNHHIRHTLVVRNYRKHAIEFSATNNKTGEEISILVPPQEIQSGETESYKFGVKDAMYEERPEYDTMPKLGW